MTHVSLRVIPGLGDGIGLPLAGVVLLDGVPHLGPEVVLHLGPKDVSEDAADQEDDEHEEEHDEVGEEHAFDLFDGSQAAEEGHEEDHAARDHEDVGRGDEEVVPQQLLNVGLVNQGPDPNAQDHEPSNLRGCKKCNMRDVMFYKIDYWLSLIRLT